MPVGVPYVTRMFKLDVQIYRSFQKSPLLFVEKIWKLTPQPVKPEFLDEVNRLINENSWSSIQASHFGEFVKGKNLTWQQWLIFLQVEKAIRGELKRISIASGHA